MRVLRTEMTSYLRKETYDVFNEEEKLVGYIQYSAGTLTCHPIIDGFVRRDIHTYWWQGGGLYDKNLPLDMRDELLDRCKKSLIDYYTRSNIDF